MGVIIHHYATGLMTSHDPSRFQQPQLGSEVQRLLGDRSLKGNSSSSTSLAYQTSVASAKGACAAVGSDVCTTKMAEKMAEAGRVALTKARELHRDGRDEEAVDILVEWLDNPLPEALATYMRSLLQAMIALGCWLCNNLATRHLHARRVARAFGYTRTCERWLAQREVEPGDSTEIWTRLEYDRALNAAELAQSSGDQLKAIAMLRECERLHTASPSLPDPEAVQLCLAEVLLQCGRNPEAASAAVRAADILRRPNLEDERKVYAYLFALSLEQAALAGISNAPLPKRALGCLLDAEAVWTLVSTEGGWGAGLSPGAQAARALMAEMKSTHDGLLARAGAKHLGKQKAPRSSSAPRVSSSHVSGQQQAPRSSSAPRVSSSHVSGQQHQSRAPCAVMSRSCSAGASRPRARMNGDSRNLAKKPR